MSEDPYEVMPGFVRTAVANKDRTITIRIGWIEGKPIEEVTDYIYQSADFIEREGYKSVTALLEGNELPTAPGQIALDQMDNEVYIRLRADPSLDIAGVASFLRYAAGRLTILGPEKDRRN